MLPSTNPVSEGSTSCPVVFCMRRDWRDSWGLGYINVQEFTWWFLGFLGFSMTPTFKLWQWICIDILYIYISVILLLLIHPMIQDVTVKRTLHHDFTGQDFFFVKQPIWYRISYSFLETPFRSWFAWVTTGPTGGEKTRYQPLLWGDKARGIRLRAGFIHHEFLWIGFGSVSLRNRDVTSNSCGQYIYIYLNI